jgi:uncharacterized membrane protein YuzA (DUF378 family)
MEALVPLVLEIVRIVLGLVAAAVALAIIEWKIDEVKFGENFSRLIALIVVALAYYNVGGIGIVERVAVDIFSFFGVLGQPGVLTTIISFIVPIGGLAFGAWTIIRLWNERSEEWATLKASGDGWLLVAIVFAGVASVLL